MATTIPKMHRPIFDGLETEDEKTKVAMAEYMALKDADDDGLTFSNKTSMWIAYERHIESQRDDRLFNDPLAQYFMGKYGKRLSDCMSFGLALNIFDPPGADIGLGLEGHVMYTAARTKLINDQVSHWLKNDIKGNASCQVLNLGAGLDTRPYWMEALKNVKVYWEVDTASVMTHKQMVLDQLKEKGDLPRAMCPIKSVSMDFSKESIADLPTNYDYKPAVPTCWILEGLIMYLSQPDVELLLDRISNLSAQSSSLILNFSENMNVPGANGPTISEIDDRMASQGWTKQKQLMFGEEGFNFKRYPQNKPANKVLGFAIYRKD